MRAAARPGRSARRARTGFQDECLPAPADSQVRMNPAGPRHYHGGRPSKGKNGNGLLMSCRGPV
jgi:hypothetical protein